MFVFNKIQAGYHSRWIGSNWCERSEQKRNCENLVSSTKHCQEPSQEKKEFQTIRWGVIVITSTAVLPNIRQKRPTPNRCKINSQPFSELWSLWLSDYPTPELSYWGIMLTSPKQKSSTMQQFMHNLYFLKRFPHKKKEVAVMGGCDRSYRHSAGSATDGREPLKG